MLNGLITPEKSQYASFKILPKFGNTASIMPASYSFQSILGV